MKTCRQDYHKKLNNCGVVSFITIILLAIVMTLITTAFVKTMISNQRQTLDNQLSSQAFYAAETGVNDVVTLLSDGISEAERNALDKLECGTFLEVLRASPDLLGEQPDVLNEDSNIKYTCVLVSQNVPNIQLSNPAVGGTSFFPIISADGNVIDKLSIVWGNTIQDPQADTPAWRLPGQTAWGTNSVALIRLTLYYPGSYSRQELIMDQKTFFLRPVLSGGNDTLAADIASQEQPYGVNCDSMPCSLDITGIDTLAGGAEGLFIKITPIYNSSNITITAYSNNVHQYLRGAQYSIDVTGRANDVYRRIEVRRGLTYDFPDSVVKTGSPDGVTGDLCKQFIIWPGGVDDVSSCSF